MFAGIPGLDLSAILANLLKTKGDTAFEQLECVGLDPAGEPAHRGAGGQTGRRLRAAVRAAAGSTEYVAFWVDWGAGLEYAGVTGVRVHDFSSIPGGGLRYNVFLPVDLLSHAKPCSAGPQTAKGARCALLEHASFDHES